MNRLLELQIFFENYGRRWNDVNQIVRAFEDTIVAHTDSRRPEDNRKLALSGKAAAFDEAHAARLERDHGIPIHAQAWCLARALGKFVKTIRKPYSNDAVVKDMQGLRSELLEPTLQRMAHVFDKLGLNGNVTIANSVGARRMGVGSDVDLVIDWTDPHTGEPIPNLFEALEDANVHVESLCGRRQGDGGRIQVMPKLCRHFFHSLYDYGKPIVPGNGGDILMQQVFTAIDATQAQQSNLIPFR